jgi:hypothetical protein
MEWIAEMRARLWDELVVAREAETLAAETARIAAQAVSAARTRRQHLDSVVYLLGQLDPATALPEPPL